MINDDRLDWIDAESRALADIAMDDYDLAVPSCPGWSMAKLLTHTGGAHRWVEITRDGRPADAEIQGTASDILLWLWNRLDDPKGAFTVIGRDPVVTDWALLRI